MRFENVAMQSNNCKNATTLRNIFTDSLITAVVKATLRKNNSHTTARFQKVQIALNK